jgi:hypothetical protein
MLTVNSADLTQIDMDRLFRILSARIVVVRMIVPATKCNTTFGRFRRGPFFECNFAKCNILTN